MVRLFVRHPVKDFAHWKSTYDRDRQLRAEGRVRDDVVCQAVEDPNDVTVWHDFDTVEDARAFGEADELQASMERAGVVGEPEVWIVRLP